MTKYLSRKERCRRLANTVDYYIIEIKKCSDLDKINDLLRLINYADFFRIRNEMNEMEKAYSSTNFRKTFKGKKIKDCCSLMLSMSIWSGVVLEEKIIPSVIQTLERFVADLRALEFVDFYGKEVK